MAEPKSGTIVRIQGEVRSTLATGLRPRPGSLRRRGWKGACRRRRDRRYAAVALAHFAVSVLADGFAALRAIAVSAGGLIAVLDMEGCRVLTLDPCGGAAPWSRRTSPSGASAIPALVAWPSDRTGRSTSRRIAKTPSIAIAGLSLGSGEQDFLQSGIRLLHRKPIR